MDADMWLKTYKNVVVNIDTEMDAGHTKTQCQLNCLCRCLIFASPCQTLPPWTAPDPHRNSGCLHRFACSQPISTFQVYTEYAQMAISERTGKSGDRRAGGVVGGDEWYEVWQQNEDQTHPNRQHQRRRRGGTGRRQLGSVSSTARRRRGRPLGFVSVSHHNPCTMTEATEFLFFFFVSTVHQTHGCRH